MASINAGRVVIGGLLAGVVMNAFDMFWNGVVLMDDMMGIAQRLGMDPAAATSFSSAIPWIAVDFVIGLAVVWNYAAIRPRFGAGVRTALLAGVAPWLTATAVVFGFTSMGLMPMAAFVKGTLATIVTMAMGSIAGAWAYKES
jgi:hypothetical protein